MNKTVWTWKNTPFTMGGSVKQPIKATIDCTGPFDLGKGFVGFAFKNKNTFHIIEKTSGGMIGYGKTLEDALSQVREDIAVGESDLMNKQISNMSKYLNQAELLSAEDFLSLLR